VLKLFKQVESVKRFAVENINKDSINEPASAAEAQQLYEKDEKEFIKWALSLIDAKPVVRDDRIHGLLGFVETSNKKQKIITHVKGDKNLVPGMIQELTGVMEKEGAVIGLIISLHQPRLGMITDTVHAGSYESDLWKKKFLKIQIRTVSELLEGKKFDIPQPYSLVKKTSKKNKPGETAKLL
jgi:site-specific DNA-methyltransferase (adenine-specific)